MFWCFIWFYTAAKRLNVCYKCSLFLLMLVWASKTKAFSDIFRFPVPFPTCAFLHPPLRSTSCRPSSTSSSSSDAAGKRRSSTAKLSCRLKPVRTKQTPTSTTTTRRAAKRETSPRDPALFWGPTTWWSWSRSSLCRGSSPAAPLDRLPSPQPEAKRSSPDFWSSWNLRRGKRSRQWLVEQHRRPRRRPQFPQAARRGHSPPTGHSVLENCSVLASLRARWCVPTGHNNQPRLLTHNPAEAT